MKNVLSDEEIENLLNIYKVSNNTVYNGMFNGFIVMYSENNNLSLEIKCDLMEITNENYYYAYDDDQDKYSKGLIKNLIKGLNKYDLKIEWFSDDFWNLFSFKGTYGCSKPWNKTIYHKDLIKEERVALVDFLKNSKKPNLFDELTKYISKYYGDYNNEYELINYWTTLAFQKKNQPKIKDMPIYKFINVLENSNKTSLILKKIKLLDLISTEDSFLELKALKDRNNNNGIIQSSAYEVLLKNGIETSLPNYDLLISENQMVNYINEKVINPHVLVYKKIVTTSELNKFLDLMEYYIVNKLNRQGIKTSFSKKEKWISSLNSLQEVIEIKSTMEYSFQKEDTEKFLQETLQVGVNDFLKKDKAILSNYDTKDINDKESFLIFFEDYIEKTLLKNKITETLDKNTNDKKEYNDNLENKSVVKRHKI